MAIRSSCNRRGIRIAHVLPMAIWDVGWLPSMGSVLSRRQLARRAADPWRVGGMRARAFQDKGWPPVSPRTSPVT
jgi:hypothetical protein